MKYADLKCPGCGPQPFMLFDASTLRERDFEGVYFRVTPTTDDAIAVTGAPEDADYLSDFNMAKLTREACETIEDGNLCDVHCSRCHEPLE